MVTGMHAWITIAEQRSFIIRNTLHIDLELERGTLTESRSLKCMPVKMKCETNAGMTGFEPE